MKIAIIASGFLPGVDGVTISGMARLKKLSQWGHQVLFFCPDYSVSETVFPNWRDYTGNLLPGVKIVNLDSTPFFGVDFERNVSRRSYQTVLQELETFAPDVIHVDEPERLFTGFWRIPGLVYARRHQIPCVSFFRTNFLDYVEDYWDLPPVAIAGAKWLIVRLLNHIYNAYDVTLVSSKITHPRIIQLGIKNTLYANLLGFDADKFSPSLRDAHFFEKTYGLPNLEQQVKLIFLGRLTSDKGWEFTLDAFTHLLAQSVDIDEVRGSPVVSRRGLSDKLALIIAGYGPMRDAIAAKLGQFTSHVYLLGRVPPETVPALLANSDIHVTTSEKETRGLTVLEAFASGIPVLATRAGGVVENIVEGWNGFLYKPQDKDDFSEKLKVLVENQTLRQEMGRNGRESIVNYSWDITVGNLVKIWEEQIAKKQLGVP